MVVLVLRESDAGEERGLGREEENGKGLGIWGFDLGNKGENV